MTSDNFSDVGDFHHRFNLPHVTCAAGPVVPGSLNRGVGPQPWDEELIEFRVRFMREELDEFVVGMAGRDHAQMADALVDLVYVAMGTAHLLGYPWQEIWEAVQRANLGKARAAADGSDSKRHSRWDVVKPAGWQPPDVAAILEAHGFTTAREEV